MARVLGLRNGVLSLELIHASYELIRRSRDANETGYCAAEKTRDALT